MTNIHSAFSKSYAEARQKFLSAAQTVGLQVESHIHPEKGRDGEELAMDVVREGPVNAKQVLLISSACHGVEGYCGSGVQIDALRSAEWHKAVAQSGVAVVYVHALNPHGFSHVRRVTQENVDLNRNFQDFSKPLPENTAYKEVQHLLLPDQWPPNEANQQATMDYIAKNGMPLCLKVSTTTLKACSLAAKRPRGVTKPFAKY
jgi:predicted deacylase